MSNTCSECGAPIIDERSDGMQTCLFGHSNPPGGKFVTPEPKPTPYQDELLTILIEECSEIIQRATKMQRFGVLEVQPGQDLNNAERLAMEYGDLTEVANRLRDVGLIPDQFIVRGIENKKAQLAKYMQTTKENDNDHRDTHDR